MKYDHGVIYGGRMYRAGEEVPLPVKERKAGGEADPAGGKEKRIEGEPSPVGGRKRGK